MLVNYSFFSIFGLHFLSLVDHFLDLFLTKSTGTLDGDGLLSVGSSVLGANMDNTIGINIESDLDLWDSSIIIKHEAMR